MLKTGSKGRRAATRTKRAGVSAKQREASRAASTGTAQSDGTAQLDGADLADADGDDSSLALANLPDGKLYYRIGEVSDLTGVKAYVLRYWESEFRWMAPQKSRSKQRLYRRKDIEMILLIRKLLYEERYTIAGARQRLRELGAGKTSAVAKAVQAELTPVSPGRGAPASSAAEAELANRSALEADYRRQLREIKNELVLIRASL